MDMNDKTGLFFNLFDPIVRSREIDILEQDYTRRGEAFFHVSGAGHENIAFLAPHLIPADYLHCHYRDKSLMLACGLPQEQFFYSLFCKDKSHSRGRQMSAHLSDPGRHILSLVGPVGNNALQSVGVADAIKHEPGQPIVLCALGDGMSQQGEVLEAVAQAVRDSLPVLFVVEDNTWAISTTTAGRTFYSHPDGDAASFYGIPIVRVDGRNPEASFDAFGCVVSRMRADRQPAIVVFQVKRLGSHTNADDHRMYRSEEEIRQTSQENDPLDFLTDWLVARGVSRQELEARRLRIREEVRSCAEEAQFTPEPKATFTAKADIPARLLDPASETGGNPADEQVVMLEAIKEVLRNHLADDPRVCLFGEDIEDTKGDVFGVTRGLSTAFPGRVRNSPLAEATIVGMGVGQALAGKRPVGFLQFADFFPIAYNQIFAEMGSMEWRTDGGWKCPLILMVSCGGFKPGLGPFHASSMESIAVHTPGIDVLMPSSAADAAGLLNAAFASGRPTIFFYPKSCLNDRTQTTGRDVRRNLVPLGVCRKLRQGTGLTFVGWGNTVALCVKAADALQAVGVDSDVIDLRSLSPWDHRAVVASVAKSRRLLIAQEDSHSASMASEISATVAEHFPEGIQVVRVSRPDTHVPCNFSNQLEVLPSYQRILENAVSLLGGTIDWQKAAEAEAGFAFVEAAGSSPSDESVTVTEWKVKAGDRLEPGQTIADMEADKAAFELSCPLRGQLVEILVPQGEMVKVGTPLLKVAIQEGRVAIKPLTQENPGSPVIRLAGPVVAESAASFKGLVDQLGHQAAGIVDQLGHGAADLVQKVIAGISGIFALPGSRKVPNSVIAETCPQWTPEEIYKRNGIESRYWCSEGENTITLAIGAARGLLAREGLSVSDLSAIICASGTPEMMTPSLACLVLENLGHDVAEAPLIPAWDVNAACSGYLYGLQAAWDHLFHEPEGRVLLITSEVLSPRTDVTDPSTAHIFGDAATATLVLGASHRQQMKLVVERPVLAAKGESGAALSVPLKSGAYVQMDGPKVFQEAVRNMVLLLEKACQKVGIKVGDLDMVVPHQANQRILNAVRQKARLPEDKVFSNIRDYGNTSSSSIPIALARIMEEGTVKGTIGLCAFGGGFTFAGGVIRTSQDPAAGGRKVG